jgi:ubiquinone/menaquinone biosynthesis C-methylase UbiE
MMHFSYVGQELRIFEHARNWKKYWSSEIRPYLSGDVLEVGAGLGANTEFLKSAGVSSWTCLEPDPALIDSMRSRFANQPGLLDCRIEIGTTEQLSVQRKFDGILYIDVLEHVEADREELGRASRLLRTGGRIVVLAPAHQWLYTDFDRAIGHFRRYDKFSLSACMPSDGTIIRLDYMDSVGKLASLVNRFLLRQAEPSLKQILFWDNYLVPPSQFVDHLTFNTVGKSILGVWRKS